MYYKFVSVLLLVGFLALVPFNPPQAMTSGPPQYAQMNSNAPVANRYEYWDGYDGREYRDEYNVYHESIPYYRYYYYPSYGYYYHYPDSEYFPRYWGPYYDTINYPHNFFWNSRVSLYFLW